MKMENETFLLTTMFILFFINVFFTAAIGDKLLKLKKQLNPKIPIDHKLLKDVDEAVLKIEKHRQKLKLEFASSAYCFNCEVEMPIKVKDEKMYCSNCGLKH